MQRLAAQTGYRPPETTFRVPLLEFGVDDTRVADVHLRRRPLQSTLVTVKVDGGEWTFRAEDGLAAAEGSEPRWMAAVLDYVGVSLTEAE